MTTTEKKFLTPAECSKISGKSEITIKRLIRQLFDQLTTSDDTKSLSLIIKEKAPKGFFWKIEEEFFREKFNIEKKSENFSADSNTADIIKIFSEQLQEKDRQMKEKDEQIKSLLERQRESNILTKNLQDKVLALEPGEKNGSGQMVDQEKTSIKKGFWKKIFG